MDKYLTAVVVLNLVLTIILVFFFFFKPKEINPLVGYRTKRSMKDQSSWSYAQNYFTKWWLLLLPIIYGSQILMFIGNIPYRLIGYFILLQFIVGSAAVIYSTEQALKKKQNCENM